jgi:hypothetical protein
MISYILRKLETVRCKKYVSVTAFGFDAVDLGGKLGHARILLNDLAPPVVSANNIC